jgi:hypothetical protein
VAGGEAGEGELRLVRTRRPAARLDKTMASEDVSDQGEKFRRKGRGWLTSGRRKPVD